jgi:chromosomal replication initiator protein
LGRKSADGADVLDHLAEIPLPGRIAGVAASKSTVQGAAHALPSFVAGPENRLVAATVGRMLSASSAPRSAPHLFTLFGPTGVGKTHLARGLVQHWQREFGNDCAHYTTAADFRRDLTSAIDANEVEAFRERIRGHRMLAIDDLHRLQASDYLSHELRYTLDAYEESGATLIVTTNRPADSLGNVSPEVRSRLASGLQLQLAAPGKAARVRIIRHASAAMGRPLPDETANQLADSAHGAAPEVFGALFEYWAMPSDAVNTAGKAMSPTLREILPVVARYTNISQKLLKSASRKQSVVFARSVAIYLARELTTASYEHIGRALGGRDHTTIMHNYQKIDSDRLQNPATQETLNELRRILLSR